MSSNDRMTEALKAVGALEGWESLDLDSEAFQNLQRVSEEEGNALAQAFHATFTSDAGKLVLNRLIAMTLLSPIARASDTEIGVGIREGRADLVRQILQQIEIGAKL